MKTGLRRIAAALCAVALAAAAVAAGSEVAKARQTTGTSTVTHAGQTSNVSSSTQFQQGDVVRVPQDGRLTVEFADGSSIAMVGPATLSFGEMSGQGRHVRLASGVITEAVVRGVALEIQGPDAYDASFILQNATGYARVAPGDKIVFQRKESAAANAYAKLWRGNRLADVGMDAWTLNLREGPAPAGGVAKPQGPKLSPGWTAHFTVHPWPDHPAGGVITFQGLRRVYFSPVKQFKGEDTELGGLRLTFIASAQEEWGVVQVLGTRLFLADGDWVEFDADGELIAKSPGVITRVDTGLFDAIQSEESVRDATDASPTTIRRP
jgi:opacity protein-like surface antigen